MPRTHILIANALLSAHRRPLHPVVAEARRAAAWLRSNTTSILLTAHVEHAAWREKFRILLSASSNLGCSTDPFQPAVRPGDPQFRANDRRHLKQQMAKHEHRLEALGSMWLRLQPKQRRKK